MGVDVGKVRLTPAQREMLRRVRDKPWQCAYTLRTTVARLDKLLGNGFVESRSGAGSVWSPQTGIKWNITAAGLKELEG
jgi:hypothetical protein